MWTAVQRRGLMLALLLMTATTCARVPVTDPPAGGEPAVGTGYHVTLSCAIPVQLGSTWWEFDEPVVWPERRRTWPWEPISFPYEVPGVILISSPSEAEFRADTDGSRLPMSRLATEPREAGCL